MLFSLIAGLHDIIVYFACDYFRKKTFGDNLTGQAPEKENEFAPGDQIDQQASQDKRDGESTSTTSETVW